MATQTQLTEARQAYHDLMVGGAVRVFVDQNGEKVEYQTANSTRLASYIEQLESELGIGGREQPRPLRFLF